MRKSNKKKSKDTEKIPAPPKGFRLVTEKERDSIRGLSGYEYAYPQFLSWVTRYDKVNKEWNPPGPYRYLWEDQIYATLDKGNCA